MQGLEQCFRWNLLQPTDHAGSVVVKANLIRAAQALCHKLSEVALHGRIAVQHDLEMPMMNAENLTVCCCLHCRTDILVTDQTHFAKDLALLQGGNRDTSVVEDAHAYPRQQCRACFPVRLGG